MIEVVQHDNGWRWQLVSAAGRILAYAGETFGCDRECADAAKAYRTTFFAHACRIDHRMGACI